MEVQQLQNRSNIEGKKSISEGGSKYTSLIITAPNAATCDTIFESEQETGRILSREQSLSLRSDSSKKALDLSGVIFEEVDVVDEENEVANCNSVKWVRVGASQKRIHVYHHSSSLYICSRCRNLISYGHNCEGIKRKHLNCCQVCRSSMMGKLSASAQICMCCSSIWCIHCQQLITSPMHFSPNSPIRDCKNLTFVDRLFHSIEFWMIALRFFLLFFASPFVFILGPVTLHTWKHVQGYKKENSLLSLSRCEKYRFILIWVVLLPLTPVFLLWELLMMSIATGFISHWHIPEWAKVCIHALFLLPILIFYPAIRSVSYEWKHAEGNTCKKSIFITWVFLLAIISGVAFLPFRYLAFIAEKYEVAALMGANPVPLDIKR
mmetsp:Transcript_45323/g.52108  ORF Transcript_45323/g.52108 Transcript_45323/m.52108 type:complete len:379 (+) Transcript_45323:556-1692(+)